jgi:hypothetical protein
MSVREQTMNLETAIGYLEQQIVSARRAGDRAKLRRIQTTFGVLMDAANLAEDKELAFRLRVLAARAANAQEELEES